MEPIIRGRGLPAVKEETPGQSTLDGCPDHSKELDEDPWFHNAQQLIFGRRPEFNQSPTGRFDRVIIK